MFKYTVTILLLLLLTKTVHCTTRLDPRGDQTLASAHVLCLPHTLVQVFQVCLGTLRIPEVSEVVQEFRSNLELEHHSEGREHRGQV